MPPRRSLRHAAILGLAQGPTELLPVSSSAHTALIPRLAGWSDAELDARAGNSFEVALHAGTAAALLIAQRGELKDALRELGGRRLGLLALALAPPAAVGYLLERGNERLPAGPAAIAAGLAVGAVGMALTDSWHQGERRVEDAGPRDGVALGLAQALALLPGISRHGATLGAARARGFDREAAQALSWRVGLPVIAGAAALKARRLAQRGVFPGEGLPLAAGATAAFLSTLASSPLIRPGRRGRPLAPFALYRCGLALLAVRRSAAARDPGMGRSSTKL
ncbi:MAG TPA: undecaprenyl-diphosphate phosphatase [Solirubrobacteraceae bacterium]|jgi:undecaprenyl-diphosphatase|nr:undecaprenyl-diphosphate phosphatase [Solirubrobacteraceae bacterium]